MITTGKYIVLNCSLSIQHTQPIASRHVGESSIYEIQTNAQHDYDVQ